MRHDPRLGPTPTSVHCGIWFLKKSGTEWVALPRPRAIGSFHYPLPTCSSPVIHERGMTVLDRLISELSGAAEVHTGKPNDYVSGLFFDIHPSDSTVIRELSVKFAQSPVLELRALGLAWKVARGEAGALLQAERELEVILREPVNRILISSIEFYSSTEPAGVHALGRIAQRAGIGIAREAAARALSSIHTKQALPYLYTLLDDHELRKHAIAGFIFFRLAVPALDSSNRDSAIEAGVRPFLQNPANQAERCAIRLGIGDSVEEARVADYWRRWFDENREKLGM